MNKFQMECMYCGHKWVETLWHKPDNLRCTHGSCNDKNITIRPLKGAGSVDYYAGSGPFEDEQDKEDGKWNRDS